MSYSEPLLNLMPADYGLSAFDVPLNSSHQLRRALEIMASDDEPREVVQRLMHKAGVGLTTETVEKWRDVEPAWHLHRIADYPVAVCERLIKSLAKGKNAQQKAMRRLLLLPRSELRSLLEAQVRYRRLEVELTGETEKALKAMMPNGEERWFPKAVTRAAADGALEVLEDWYVRHASDTAGDSRRSGEADRGGGRPDSDAAGQPARVIRRPTRDLPGHNAPEGEQGGRVGDGEVAGGSGYDGHASNRPLGLRRLCVAR